MADLDIEKLLAENEAKKAEAAKSVATLPDESIGLFLTKTEAQCLAEIFNSHLAGEGLYADGTPLNDLYHKVGAVREIVGTTHHTQNVNEVTHTDRRWLPNLKRWSDRSHFGSRYAILRYFGPKR